MAGVEVAAVRELGEARRPWWRRWLGMAMIGAFLPALAACSPMARQAAGDAGLDIAITDAITILGVAAGTALRDALD